MHSIIDLHYLKQMIHLLCFVKALERARLFKINRGTSNFIEMGIINRWDTTFGTKTQASFFLFHSTWSLNESSLPYH
jgi:hypothetical protein